MQYLLVALVLTLLSGFLWALFIRQKQTPRIIRGTIPGLSLRLSHTGGLADTLIFPVGRVRCGFSPDYDIDLSQYVKVGRITGKSRVEELVLQLVDGRLAVTAHSKVMMNGVERSSGSIPVNGSLLFKTCRLTFLGQVKLQKEQTVYPGPSALKKLAAAPTAASLAAIILLILGLVDLGTSGYFQRFAPRAAVVVEQKAQPVPTIVVVPTIAAVPEPTPELVKRPVVVPLRSAVRPEPIKPVPERHMALALEKKPITVPLRSTVRPEPIKPVPERNTAPALVKKTITVPLRSTVRPEPIKPVPERSPAPPTEQPSPVHQPPSSAGIAATLPSRAESRPVLRPESRPMPRPEPKPLPTPYPAPRVVKPGDPIPEIHVDVLFIHAHPDDESLDYGALMALCMEAGLTTATVLLTDGEGGIYQQDYTGPRDNMVSTRIKEATRAMQFLGSSIYIRLGLKNNPYNSQLEEKGVQEILQLWDGKAVAAKIAGIINTLGPKVVVSPEGPSFAREHFEHETTGVLTLMALQHLRLTGGHLPEAHLVSVDPRQKDAYSGLISFPRQGVMERQRQALLAHATQADATYFGVQIIDTYREEYYLIQYWDIAVHFTRFFGLVSASNTPVSGPDVPLMSSVETYRQFP